MFRLFMTVALLIVFAPRADASIQASNDSSLVGYQSADGNNITTDTATGLDWLDVDTTRNISVDDMTARLAGGNLPGFRYANLTEVEMFFDHLGLPAYPAPFETGQYPDPGSALFLSASAYTGLSAPGVYPLAGGFVAPEYQADPIEGLGVVSTVAYYFTNVPDRVQRWQTTYYSTDPQPYFGSWLVRSTVPEPLSAAVWGLLVTVALVAARRQRGQ